MERKVGTVSRGIRCPIIRENDNLADIVVTSVLEAAESEGLMLFLLQNLLSQDHKVTMHRLMRLLKMLKTS